MKPTKPEKPKPEIPKLYKVVYHEAGEPEKIFYNFIVTTCKWKAAATHLRLCNKEIRFVDVICLGRVKG